TMFFSPWRRWLLQQLRALKPVSRTRRRHNTRRRPQLEVLEDRLAPASHTWTGASATTNAWSDPANWAGGRPGVGGGTHIDLIFPAGAPQATNNNDLVGLTIERIDLQGGGYTLNGNQITLGGSGIAGNAADTSTITNTAGSNVIALPLDVQGVPTQNAV